MTGLKRLATLPIRSGLASLLRRTRHALLPETDQLHRRSFLGKNDMRFLGVAGRALGLVVASELLTAIFDHCFVAHALSIRFGYGRPAFAARVCAFFFCPAVNGLDFLFGFFVSQNGVFFFIDSPPLNQLRQ